VLKTSVAEDILPKTSELVSQQIGVGYGAALQAAEKLGQTGFGKSASFTRATSAAKSTAALANLFSP
jgi:hypothetical protein